MLEDHLLPVVRLEDQRELVERLDPTQQLDPAGEIDRHFAAVLKAYMRDRNWKRATQYVQKILYYDPINEEALDLKEEIDANRITRKLSDITNARPRITGG